MKESEDLSKYKFILWADFGYDGWRPYGCSSEKELLAKIAETYGNDYIVTSPCAVAVAISG
jgi:hypothetical protein